MSGKGIKKKSATAKRLLDASRTHGRRVRNPALLRLARRSGVKRVKRGKLSPVPLPRATQPTHTPASALLTYCKSDVYDEIRSEIERFVDEIVRNAVTWAEHREAIGGPRKTVMIGDMLQALRVVGRKVWGWE
ncbi:hypothetical protein FN846DRAFT_980477 [Sphaerosporella brunnea]|uniref:Histone H4 n=1 Tax=Sphaerosporella brunnea TaxID=1250544 RepID=A0A5J5EEE4_9PEZI|nr:hypothetical protein FN846DRAFT_980477 [Sphaerosporella brunnea]